MTNTAAPRIVAKLQIDEKGNPAFVKTGELNHYRIVFEVENIPNDAYAATFELHPNYYDPVRTLQPDKDGKFHLKTTTYGDYPIKVLLRTKNGRDQVITSSVKTALMESIGSKIENPKIAAALEYIAAH